VFLFGCCGDPWPPRCLPQQAPLRVASSFRCCPPTIYSVMTGDDDLGELPSAQPHSNKQIADEFPIPHTGLHAFRHAAARELLEEGAPLTVVQKQPRHRDARTTLQKYGHVVGDAQRDAVNTLAEKIERIAAIELAPRLEMVPSST